MRIVLTSESYLPYLSGVTVSVDALARGLGAAGHEVLVVAPEPAPGTAVDDIGSPGPAPNMAWLPSYRLPAIAPPLYRMPWPLPTVAAWGAARDFAPDVVHAHSPFASGVMARRLARSCGAPLVFTHHTRFDDYSHYAGPFSAIARRATDAWLGAWWRACDAVIVPSEELAVWIRRQIGERRTWHVRVIPTGVDVAGIRALEPVDVRAMTGWPSDGGGGRVTRTTGAGEESRDPHRRRRRRRGPPSRAPAAGRRWRAVGTSAALPVFSPPAWRSGSTSPDHCRGWRRSPRWPERICSRSPRARRPRASS